VTREATGPVSRLASHVYVPDSATRTE